MSDPVPIPLEVSEQVGLLAELKALAEAARAAQTQIETALAAAEKARAAAEAARLVAEEERDVARTAKAAVETLRVETAGEKEKAVIAATDAAKSRTDAEAAKSAALKDKLAAEAALAGALTAQTAATEASTGALAARKGSEDEKRLAELAKKAASAAETAAKAAEAEATKAALKAAESDSKAGLAYNMAEAAKRIAEEASTEATSEAKKAAEAHNLSTTAGLAGAFNEKALGTRGRERFWGAVLVLSLVAAGAIGWVRYSDLTELLRSKPDISVLTSNMILSLFGVAAPVWLAWMSTRMVSKNFALTEDYAYKASLAKAYVGFRQEAKGLDPIFEQRLFAAAITQLDANPVRFLSDAHPGSPLQDLLQQPFMREALKDETFKAKVVEWLKVTFRAKVSTPAATPALPPAETSGAPAPIATRTAT